MMDGLPNLNINMSLTRWVFNSVIRYNWNPCLGWTFETTANYALPNANFIVPSDYQEGLDFVLRQIAGPQPLAEPE